MGETRENAAILSAGVLCLALEQCTQSITITDADGCVVYLNRSATGLLGSTLDEATGEHLEKLIVPADGVSSMVDLLAGVTPQAPFVGTLMVRDKVDRILPISMSLSVVTGPDGAPSNFIGVMSELTAAEAAPWAAEMLASIATSSCDGIMATDRHGIIRWANDAIRDVFGWPREELVGQHISVLIPEEEHETQAARIEAIMAGAAPARPFVSLRRRRDGTLIEVAVTLGPVRDADGNVQGVSIVARDVTEEQRTQRELHQVMELHRARFEQVPMPQALVDLEGRFLSVNEALCELTGFPREELVGRRIRALLHPANRGENEDEIRPLLEGARNATTYERVGRAADGRPIPVLLDVAMLRDHEGNAYAMALFVRDLTEVRQAQQSLASQTRLFQALSHRSSDASVVLDASLRILYVSPAAHTVFGYDSDQILRLGGWDFVHPDDVGEAGPVVAAVSAEFGRSERLTVRIKDAQGNWRWVEQTITNCLDDPDIEGLVVNLRDINDQVLAQRSLRESEARYRAIVATAQEGILAVDAEGRTILANEKMAEIAGVALDDLYTSQVLHTLDQDVADTLSSRLRAGRLTRPENYEVVYPHPDGEERTFSISASPLTTDDGEPLGVLNMVSDVTEARRTEKRLRWQALHDALTGLPNRELLVDRLSMAIVRRERSNTAGVAVLFLDLDEFKLINDSRGHEAGDQLLKETAARLELAVRATDTVARIGGDEFAVVCEDADEQAALEVAHRIRDSLSQHIDVGGEPLYVGASIGVALYPPHAPSALLRFADTAMYKAKSLGGNTVVVFDETLATGSERRLAISNLLREALNADRVQLSYQPIADLVSGTVLGVEALLSWPDDPVIGPVPAGEIVSVAEQTGMSQDLDRVVLGTACTEFMRLRQAHVVDPDAYVSVNISARTLGKTLSDLVMDALARSGLPPRNLMLEITENTVMDDAEHAADALHALQGMGVSVAIDDFGTGYSSLAHLQRLPINVLKIDRSFVANVKPGSIAIARSIVVLAHAIGVRTVADGVERQEQADTMRAIGCDAGQGPRWHPGAAVEDLLSQGIRIDQ